MDNKVKVIKFIRTHWDEVGVAIREAYKESLQESDYYEEKVLVYDNKIVHWSHPHGCWSQAEQDGVAICIDSFRGAGDDEIDDGTAEYLMDVLDVDGVIDDAILKLDMGLF